jgi:RNase P protein component
MEAKAHAGFDYVLIARREAISAPFPALLDHLGRAMTRLHK